MSDNGDQLLEIDGLDIRYRVSRVGQPPRGRVLILPGFTEFIEKYEEATENHEEPPCKRLNDLGFDTLVLDWPGQGRSTRLTDHSKHLIHSRGFDFHLDCLNAVAKEAGFEGEFESPPSLMIVSDSYSSRDEPEPEAEATPLFIFGHSMGGHLAMRYAHERAPACRGVIVTSPMILPPVLPPCIPPPPIPLVWLARTWLKLAKRACRRGREQHPTPCSGNIRSKEFKPNNHLTRDRKGYAVHVDWWKEDERLESHGASYGWARDAFHSCFATTANANWMEEWKGKFGSRFSAHIAGDERIVNGAMSRKMLPEDADAGIYHYPDARHELLLEEPDVVEAIWRRVQTFLDKRLDAG